MNFHILDQFGRNLYGPGIESRLGRDFQNPFRPALGPTQSPVHCVLGHVPGIKAGGAWRLPHTLSSAEFKDRVEFYLYPL